MHHLKDVLTTGRGRDPDADIDITIAEEEVKVKGYDDRLSAVMDASRARGWALDVIEDCLFIAAYRGKSRRAAPVIFKGWFEHFARKKSP